MGEIFRLNNRLKFSIYSNDHEPAHVHVVYGNNEKSAKVEIQNQNVIENNGFSGPDLKLIKEAIKIRINKLQEKWDEIQRDKIKPGDK